MCYALQLDFQLGWNLDADCMQVVRTTTFARAIGVFSSALIPNLAPLMPRHRQATSTCLHNYRGKSLGYGLACIVYSLEVICRLFAAKLYHSIVVATWLGFARTAKSGLTNVLASIASALRSQTSATPVSYSIATEAHILLPCQCRGSTGQPRAESPLLGLPRFDWVRAPTHLPVDGSWSIKCLEHHNAQVYSYIVSTIQLSSSTVCRDSFATSKEESARWIRSNHRIPLFYILGRLFRVFYSD